MLYLVYVYIRNPEGGVSDHHDGQAGRTVVGMTVHHMCPLKDTWKKNERPLETGSLTTRTVVLTCVRWGTLGKKMETLRRGVYECYDGHAGRTIMGTTVRHMCPLKDTWKKNERPLEKGSLSSMTVMQDGPSRERRSVTCVQ